MAIINNELILSLGLGYLLHNAHYEANAIKCCNFARKEIFLGTPCAIFCFDLLCLNFVKFDILQEKGNVLKILLENILNRALRFRHHQDIQYF